MINKKYRRKTVEIIVKSSDERKLSTPNTRLRIGLVKKKKKKKKKKNDTNWFCPQHSTG